MQTINLLAGVPSIEQNNSLHAATRSVTVW